MALDSEHLRSLFGILSRWSRSSSELKITDTHRLGLSVLCDSPASGFRNQQEKIPQGETEPRPDTVTNGEAENRQHHSSWKVCHHLSQHLGRNPGGGGTRAPTSFVSLEAPTLWSWEQGVCLFCS